MTSKKRKARLKELLKRIKAGEDVAQRDLRHALTDAEYQLTNEKWKEQQAFRAMKKPSEVKKYESLLAKALFLHNKAEGYRAKKKLDARGRSYRQRLYDQAEAACELALECLYEILTADAALQIWFDRAIKFCADGTVDLLNSDISFPDNMPRLVTSRSKNKLASRMVGRLAKREIKKAVLEDALEEISREEKRQKRGKSKTQEVAEVKARMAGLLQKARRLA